MRELLSILNPFPCRKAFGLLLLIAAQTVLGSHLANGAPAGPPRTPAVQWRSNPAAANTFVVEVSGLSLPALKELGQGTWSPAQWQRLLCIYAEQSSAAANAGLPPVLGSYAVRSNTVCFEPQFPLVREVRYRAVCDPSAAPGAAGPNGELLTALFQLPSPGRISSTRVAGIYPSARVLPENLLKFYLHFSAPMSRGHIYDYIHLFDDKGKEVELPFLEIDEELWNPELTRLTLFIDPGRIKRGVRPLEEIGPALQEGKRYTLVIDRAWKDGQGIPLKESFRKSFKVAAPDRAPLDPAGWKIQAPKSGTRRPATLVFSKPMDHALAQRIIHVTDKAGQLVPGQTALRDEEREWTFVPDAPWTSGLHRLLIETTLEDLAGNNIGKPFEVDLLSDPQERLTNPTVKLSFEIR